MTQWGTVRPSADTPPVSGGLTRRRVLRLGATSSALVLGSLTFPSVITPARGAPKTVTIGMYSGPRTELVKSTIIKRLEEKYNVKILVDEGWTTTQLGRLRAGKNNPTHTMMWMDDIGVNIARKEGLIDKLPEDKIPNMAQVFPQYVVEDGYGVGIDVSTVALTYSTRDIKQPPSSWAAFWDPAYKGKVSVPSISGTHGLNLVVVAAALETGKPFHEAQYESDAAFKKLAELKSNLHSVFVQNALLMAAFQEGDVVMTGPFYASTIWPYIDSGLPANHIIPKEGAFAGLGCQTLVHGGPHLDLGAEFINAILAPETQVMMCQKLSTNPVVQGIELPPQTLARLSYGAGQTEKLFVSDWEFINKIRPEWTERWNKIFS